MMWLTCFVLIASIFFSGCSNDDPKPSKGTIAGSVTDFASGAELPGALVVVFNALSNSPEVTTTTNATGDYSVEVNPGKYFLKFYKQGYLPVPAADMQAVSFEVVAGQTNDQPAEMTASSAANIGLIKGRISAGNSGQAGVLVVAELDGQGYSGVSDKDGNYTIFNVPQGTYDVRAYLVEYSSSVVQATVATGAETADINISLSKNAAGSVAGTFKVISQTTIAESPATMDIALVHPHTRETIPGLSKSLPYSSSINFSFANVPDGTYIVRATWANDYIVIDPDYITKFGDYEVTVSGGVAAPASVDIVSTSAVILATPTNEMAVTVPVEEMSTTPTFDWNAYPSTSDYVIEVTDAATGQVVWGGFSNSGTVTKNIIIPSNTTAVLYNFDGTASVGSLTPGKVYRWRIFASKDNVDGWKLIAASEDQMGLIKIK